MKRGRYGEFLRDDSKDIPRTSLFQINNRQARQEEQRIDEHQEQPNQAEIPVQFEDDINIEECECQQVNNIHDLKKTGSYFLYLPLKDQLVSMLSDETVRRELRWEDDSESDVISGQLYKSLLRRGVVRKERDLTIQFNTDGVEAFKSSSVQMWPIQVCVNELPFKFRKENIILCGLWYDYCKPNMNTFLAPFIEELNSLRQVGFKVNPNDPHFIKVHTLLSSVDSMARAPLQNIQYVRGESSCSFCLHPGEDVAVGEGSARCFLGDIYPLRTNAQHLRDVNRVQADPTLKHVNGVKGPSALLLLDGFDIANSFVPDYLHCVLLGVVKTMVDKCWLATSNHGQPTRNGNGDVKLYKRFILKNAMYHIESYQERTQRVNCAVQLTDGKKLEATADVLCRNRYLQISSQKFVTVVRKTSTCLAIHPDQISRKCVLTFCPGNPRLLCCFPLVNVLERD
ncbi:Mechanosensitive ion channel protein 5 [Frankliniella fusca]|uniref:Mechanosensitive ion channel protein 5 n=1 Tax=Frankliniella fusca TaxID=407009 RepID=A0AAE1LTV9_9NEOP|nr:Mechanosensitive ion channel protein 5 [Frankliniella fusca]